MRPAGGERRSRAEGLRIEDGRDSDGYVVPIGAEDVKPKLTRSYQPGGGPKGTRTLLNVPFWGAVRCAA